PSGPYLRSAYLRSTVRRLRILGRPRPSTLFPYTTLFRSWTAPRLEVGRRGRDRRGRPLRQRAIEELAPEHPIGRADGRDPRGAEDRKSTRLNSSHVKISYAVFCLKKKNLRDNATIVGGTL